MKTVLNDIPFSDLHISFCIALRRNEAKKDRACMLNAFFKQIFPYILLILLLLSFLQLEFFLRKKTCTPNFVENVIQLDIKVSSAAIFLIFFGEDFRKVSLGKNFFRYLTDTTVYASNCMYWDEIFFQLSRIVTLKGQCHEIFCFWFF